MLSTILTTRRLGFGHPRPRLVPQRLGVALRPVKLADFDTCRRYREVSKELERKPHISSHPWWPPDLLPARIEQPESGRQCPRRWRRAHRPSTSPDRARGSALHLHEQHGHQRLTIFSSILLPTFDSSMATLARFGSTGAGAGGAGPSNFLFFC